MGTSWLFISTPLNHTCVYATVVTPDRLPDTFKVGADLQKDQDMIGRLELPAPPLNPTPASGEGAGTQS